MKVKNKRYYLYILEITATVLVIAILILFGVHALQKSFYVGADSVDFRNHKTAFNYLAQTYYKRFVPAIKSDENISHITIHPLGSSVIITYYYFDERDYVSTIEEIGTDTQSYFSEMYEAFSPDSEGRGGFWDIHIFDRQVAFRRCGDRYALIYSKSCRPSYIVDPNERVFVDRVSFNWYNVVNKNGHNAKPI
jgi:hypothetical protein